MRLHHLTVSAFGPFAGTERVDFEELNDAGLFLLTGATGAGKSSLLDAVCFALYGTVPGARGTKTLKSQHAPADVGPEVVLDFSVQGRRFVLRRTPEWSRPKRRGEGLITEKASASLLETTGGGEHLLTSRAAEVGLQVTELMGMNAAQFVQVALLPQGEFQTFLRASSQDRHAVLQHLFRTDRFARIEDWVHDESRRLREQAGGGRSVVQRLVDTIAERAGLSTPDGLSEDALAPAAADGRLMSWVEAVLDAAQAAAEQARVRDEDARAALDESRRLHDQAVQQATLRRRRDAALAALASLADSEDAAAEARRRVAADERAGRCAPVLDLHARVETARARAAGAHQAAVLALRTCPALHTLDVDLPADPSGPLPPGIADGLRARSARLRALLPRVRAADDARRALRAERALLRTVEEDRDAATARAEQVPVDLAERAEALAESSARAARHDAVAVELRAARVRQAAAAELDEVRLRLVDLGDDRRAARDRMQDARERVQELVGRRLAGMAAELAGALEDGTPCQVCGSVDHPRLATPGDDAVTDADQLAAETVLAERVVELEATEAALSRQQSRADSLAATAAGLTTAAASAAVDQLSAALDDAAAARRRRAVVEGEILELRELEAALGRRRSEAAERAAGLRQSVASRERLLAEVSAELADALGGDGGRPVHAVLDDLTTVLGLVVEVQRAADDLAGATERADTAAGHADQAAAEHGFASPADVAAARLGVRERGRLVAELAARTDVEARAQAVLDDPAFDTLDDEPPVDPAPLAVESGAAEAAAAHAARDLALLEDRARALRNLRERLVAALEEWAPLRDASLRVESMSRLVRGMGSDNQLQMRLSAYVLATRLDQVVAAANERLGHLRDQRYLLQRTGRAERRGSQAGLGLEVVDQWTGDVRSPATLSGGETFVVSLSLALGLADVVTQEAGGTEVETLFVDEGFGTLDADTLDDVMDRLDGLRAGGRTVGVVSHVTELRSRIPTQVHVEKTRTGSVVTVRTLVG